MTPREAAERIIGSRPSYGSPAMHANAIEDSEQIIQAAINEATSDLQAEVTRLRDENKQLLEELSATEELSGLLHMAMQRSERAELLVRLMRKYQFDWWSPAKLPHWIIEITGHNIEEWVDFDKLDTNGIPDLTGEQWERLAELAEVKDE